MRVLTTVTRAIARILGSEVSSEAQITAEELRLIVERGGEQGVLEAEEEQMINAVIELGEPARPRGHGPAHRDRRAPGRGLARGGDRHRHRGGPFARIPVYEDSIDEVVGILYAKDLLPYLKSDAGAPAASETLLRPPVLVPESMTIDDLLHEFQRRKVHIAIVLDEYGGTAGLVTIEDLLEEIVGEIQDEYDVEEPMVVRLSDDEARIDGRADVDELAELFDIELELEDEDEYDTIGGLIYHRIGGVPKPGDQIEVDGPDPDRRDDRWAARRQGPRGPEAARGRGWSGGRRRSLAPAACGRPQAAITETMISSRRARASGRTTPAASSSARARSRCWRAWSRV